MAKIDWMRIHYLKNLLAFAAAITESAWRMSAAQPTHEMLCDSHKWFQGFAADATDIDYTAFDMSKDEDYAAVGGTNGDTIVAVYEFKSGL